MHVLFWMKRHITTSILVGMGVGFLIGLLVDMGGLSGWVLPLSFAMVFPMMVTLDFSQLLTRGNRRLQLVTQAVNFIYLPALAWAVGWLFFRDTASYRIALLLMALLPTSGMTVSWTVMAKGNVNEAVRMIVFGLLLGGLLAPLYLGLFMGEAANVPFMAIVRQMVVIVFLPMGLGYLVRKAWVGRVGEARFQTTVKPYFPAFSTLAVVTLIALVTGMRAPMLAADPWLLLRIALPLIVGYGVMVLSLHWLGSRLFVYADRIAMINGTMIRNLSLSLAIALSVFDTMGAEIALVVAVAYMVQVQAAGWYVRFSVAKQAFQPS